MLQKLAAHENPWIQADNLERLKMAATALVYTLALIAGVVGVVVGLL